METKKQKQNLREKILNILTVNDLFIWSSWSLLQPFIALWATQTIPNVGAEEVGTATMTYTIMSAIISKPLGKLLDKIKGYNDEIIFLSLGGITAGIAIFTLQFVRTVELYYLAEAIIGLGLATDVISWRILFTHNISPKKAGHEWSTYGMMMSVGLALSAWIGGYLAKTVGYNTVFSIAGILTILGGIIPTILFKIQKNREK